MPSDWTQPSVNGDGESPDMELSLEEKEAEEKKKRDTLLYLKALRESGKAHTKLYMDGFHDAWGYVIGDKRFPAPANQAAKQQAKHLSRTARPRLYATLDHKVAVLTEAEPRVIMKALQPISEVDRRKLESVLESILEELHWGEDRHAVAWDAEIGGIGLAMFYVDQNELTGELEIKTKIPDPSKIYVNKQATSFRDARYVVYEEDISLAEIRQRWPDEGYKVKAKSAKPCGAAEDGETYQEKTDDQIVEMPGNEFLVSAEGQVVDQEATITWAWEKRTETREVWEKAKNVTPTDGHACLDCQSFFLDEDGICPECYMPGEPTEVPAGAEAMQKFVRKQFPYGRCIIGIPEQNIVLYEGENELPLKRVYPFAKFDCYRKSRSFYHLGDYHLMKSCTKALDQNLGLLQDHMRYNAHPILEHPASAEIYNTIGTAPGTRAPVDDELCNLAHFLNGGQFDYQGFMQLEAALNKEFDQGTAVDETAKGGGPNPESGEAIKTRQMARGKRLAGTLKRLNEFSTDYAAIAWELATALYTQERTFTVRGVQNQLDAISLNLSELPYDVVVQVTADPDKVETDRLMGQNLGQFITSGAIFDPRLLPFMDDILSGFGLEPYRADMIQQKLNAFHEQQAQQMEQQAQMQMQMGAPPDMGGPPPEEMPQGQPMEGMVA